MSVTVSDARVSAPPGPPPRLVRPRHHGLAGRSTWPISLLSIVVLGAAWELVSRYGLVTPLFLPSPGDVGTQLIAVATEGYANATLAEHLAASLGRIVSALLIAAAMAIPLGLAMGLSRWAKGVADPIIEFYWPLPPLAYLPLMIIWLGIGETSKVTLLTLAMFAPICLSAQAGVRGLSAERINAALTLGGTRLQVFRTVVLPGALPDILTGLRIAIGVGWSTLVAAELIAATRGIGFMIMSAAQFLATDVVFVGIGVIAAFAFLFSLGMRLLERWLVPWHGRG
ncbi:ABC transporter permease subunit [Lichenihabitans sp. Uapishka_5]|uniref:ABC transporter permease subunit n=1 Tax=Lichenihabitans sp. Uapishka_5 TaxID=3037302 RepID=UPI0029E7F3B3|nr:ABC transporter permease subunit [Lichenihabitans sp. Uapishka_5]MDX7951533.1 ABC transporter permease subunit [Lichenihabitans sp. Uapishka_5]